MACQPLRLQVRRETNSSNFFKSVEPSISSKVPLESEREIMTFSYKTERDLLPYQRMLKFSEEEKL